MTEKPDLWANGASCFRCLANWKVGDKPWGFYPGYDKRGRTRPCTVCGHTTLAGPFTQEEWDALKEHEVKKAAKAVVCRYCAYPIKKQGNGIWRRVTPDPEWDARTCHLTQGEIVRNRRVFVHRPNT